MFDAISYIMGKKKGETDGEKTVNLDGSGYTYTDTGDGNVVITTNEEVTE